jgi:hypothetical protein
MSPLFESFESLNRSWSERVLESTSLRRIFVYLLSSVFMLGTMVGMELFSIGRLHRFEMRAGLLFSFVTAAGFTFRFSQIVYQKLGR